MKYVNRSREKERDASILIAEKELCTIIITDEKVAREKARKTSLVQLHFSTFRIFPFILETK